MLYLSVQIIYFFFQKLRIYGDIVNFVNIHPADNNIAVILMRNKFSK